MAYCIHFSVVLMTKVVPPPPQWLQICLLPEYEDNVNSHLQKTFEIICYQ